jgi:hypothetical protein
VLRFLDGRVMADEPNATPDDAQRLLAGATAVPA